MQVIPLVPVPALVIDEKLESTALVGVGSDTGPSPYLPPTVVIFLCPTWYVGVSEALLHHVMSISVGLPLNPDTVVLPGLASQLQWIPLVGGPPPTAAAVATTTVATTTAATVAKDPLNTRFPLSFRSQSEANPFGPAPTTTNHREPLEPMPQRSLAAAKRRCGGRRAARRHASYVRTKPSPVPRCRHTA